MLCLYIAIILFDCFIDRGDEETDLTIIFQMGNTAKATLLFPVGS
jgi:hypothetical protein